MRLAQPVLPLYVLLSLCTIIGNGLSYGSSNNVHQAKSPSPFHVEYKVQFYTPPKPALSDADLAKAAKKLRKELSSKNYSTKVIDNMVKQSVAIMKMPSGGHREVKFCFGAGNESILYAYQWDERIPNRTILKPDKMFKWDLITKKQKKYFPILRISPTNPTNPPKTVDYEEEAVIFGFQTLKDLFKTEPKVSQHANGDATLEYEVNLGEHRSKRHYTIVLDQEGRIKSYLTVVGTGTNAGKSVWTASNYVQANGGWIPKTITRRLTKGQTLYNSLDYKLIKLETGKPVLDEWFSDKVNGPTFVEDSRYRGMTVKYFTNDKLLSDREVERRALALAGQESTLRYPISFPRAIGIALLLVGVALLVWRFGWLRNQQNEDSDSKANHP